MTDRGHEGRGTGHDMQRLPQESLNEDLPHAERMDATTDNEIGHGRISIDKVDLSAALVDQLFSQSHSALYGALISTFLLTAVLWNSAPRSLLVAWAVVMVSLYAGRHVLVTAYRMRSPSGRVAIRWGNWFAFFSTLAGLLWGAAAVVFFPTQSVLHQAVLVVLIGGLSSGTVVVYAPLTRAYVPFVLVGGLPLAVMFFYQGTPIHAALGTIIVVYIAVLLVTGGRMNATITAYLSLRFEKDRFIKELKAQRSAAQELARDLQLEVLERKEAEAALEEARDKLENRVQERTAELAQANESLRKEKQRFESLAENAPFGTVLIDKNSGFQYLNRKFTELLGYELSDVPNAKTWFRTAYPEPEYRKEVVSAWKDDCEQAVPGETSERVFTVRCKDEAEKIIHFRIVKLATGENLMTCEDITERIRSEQILEESEERYREIAESSLTGIFIHQNGIGVYVNRRLCEMLGYSREEMLGSPFLDAVHPDDRQMVLDMATARLMGDDVPFRYESRLLHKNGDTVYGEIHASVISYGGRPAIMGNIADITQRKRAEEAQRESEERYRSLFEESIAPTFFTDVDGTIVDANRACENLFGYHAEELLGRNVRTLYVDPADRLRFERDVDRTGFVRGYPQRYRKSDGTQIECIIHAGVRKSKDGEVIGYRESLRDIVKQKAGRRQLFEAL